MPWTWVTEDFNRSDRPLDGEPVGASSLKWRFYAQPALSAGIEPYIVSNIPREQPATTTASAYVVTNVAPLAAGSTIRGVGVEAYWSAGTTYRTMIAALRPASASAKLVMLQTDGTSSALFWLPAYISHGRRPSVGVVRQESLDIRPELATVSHIRTGESSPWPAGTTVRLEVVFGSAASYFFNGVLAASASLPGDITSSHTMVGVDVNSLSTSDNWRVGVLT